MIVTIGIYIHTERTATDVIDCLLVKMNRCISIIFLIGLLAPFFFVHGQDVIGCFVEGECRNSLYLNATDTSTPRGCLAFCKATEQCDFFSHYAELSVCHRCCTGQLSQNFVCSSAMHLQTVRHSALPHAQTAFLEKASARRFVSLLDQGTMTWYPLVTAWNCILNGNIGVLGHCCQLPLPIIQTSASPNAWQPVGVYISHLTPPMVSVYSLRTVTFNLAQLVFMERPIARPHQNKCLQVGLIIDNTNMSCSKCRQLLSSPLNRSFETFFFCPFLCLFYVFSGMFVCLLL